LEYHKTFLRDLNEHLQGIKGADNKLRKLVWYQLNFSQNNPEYAIIFLQLRYNPKFYRSPAYELAKEHANILLRIIEEGKQEGIFRAKVNGRLVRDMVFGTLDHFTLPWIIFKRQRNLVESSEELCALFLNAIETKGENNDLQKGRRDSIISLSTSLFSKKGFNNSTISEIANLVGIAESTIYEYFNSKEEILFTIPKTELELFLLNLEELVSPKGPANRLKKVVWNQLHFFQNHREYTTVLLIDLRPNPRFYRSPAYELMKKYSKVLLNIIEEGKREGNFRQSLNGRLVRDMIFGTLDHIVLPWIIFKRRTGLTEKNEELCDLFLNAIVVKEKN